MLVKDKDVISVINDCILNIPRIKSKLGKSKYITPTELAMVKAYLISSRALLKKYRDYKVNSTGLLQVALQNTAPKELAKSFTFTDDMADVFTRTYTGTFTKIKKFYGLIPHMKSFDLNAVDLTTDSGEMELIVYLDSVVALAYTAVYLSNTVALVAMYDLRVPPLRYAQACHAFRTRWTAKLDELASFAQPSTYAYATYYDGGKLVWKANNFKLLIMTNKSLSSAQE